MVSSVTPSQTRNLGNDNTRGRGQGRGRGSTGGTGNLQIEATQVGRSILSNYNQVRQQRVGDRMRLWVVLHKWKAIFC
jgi:ribosomal protein L15